MFFVSSIDHLHISDFDFKIRFSKNLSYFPLRLAKGFPSMQSSMKLALYIVFQSPVQNLNITTCECSTNSKVIL